jgi:hypothetical protein
MSADLNDFERIGGLALLARRLLSAANRGGDGRGEQPRSPVWSDAARGPLREYCVHRLAIVCWLRTGPRPKA